MKSKSRANRPTAVTTHAQTIAIKALTQYTQFRYFFPSRPQQPILRFAKGKNRETEERGRAIAQAGQLGVRRD